MDKQTTMQAPVVKLTIKKIKTLETKASPSENQECNAQGTLAAVAYV